MDENEGVGVGEDIGRSMCQECAFITPTGMEMKAFIMYPNPNTNSDPNPDPNPDPHPSSKTRIPSLPLAPCGAVAHHAPPSPSRVWVDLWVLWGLVWPSTSAAELVVVVALCCSGCTNGSCCGIGCGICCD